LQKVHSVTVDARRFTRPPPIRGNETDYQMSHTGKKQLLHCKSRAAGCRFEVKASH
jgi:hypothetical protein